MAPPREPTSEWRKAIPVRAGWYWWRSSYGAPIEVLRVALNGTIVVVGYPHPNTPVELFGGEWSGPLYPPN